MKIPQMTWMLLCAALALPAAAWAQHEQAPPMPGHDGHGSHDAMAFGGHDDDFPPGDLFLDDDHGGAGPGMHGRMRGPGMHRGGHGRASLHRRFANLDLTEQQRDKMRDIHDAAQRKNIQREADMKLARLDLHKLMSADSPNSQAINTQIDKLSKLRGDAMKAHIDTYMQARALLTPEQLQKLKEPPAAGSGRKKMKQSGDASGGI